MGGIYGADTFTLPIAWLTFLATSDLRLAVYAMRALYGVTRFLHLVGMASFVGMVVVLDFRGLGLVPPGALDAVRPLLVRVLQIAFWIVIATGGLLFLRDPVGVGLHSMFLPKLLLILIGYALARAVPHLPRTGGLAPLRRAAPATSLVIWLLVIAASTWNHVERPVRVTDALRAHNIGK